MRRLGVEATLLNDVQRSHRKRPMMKFALFLLLTLSGLGAPNAAGAAELIRAPYLQNATADSITLRWMTDIPAESHVSYSPELGGASLSLHSTTPTIHHEVEITGLIPATKYSYVVADENGLLAPADDARYFRTNPVPGTPADPMKARSTP